MRREFCYINTPVILLVWRGGNRRPNLLLRRARVTPDDIDLSTGLAVFDIDIGQRDYLAEVEAVARLRRYANELAVL